MARKTVPHEIGVDPCADHVLNHPGQRAKVRYPLRRLAATVPRKPAKRREGHGKYLKCRDPRFFFSEVSARAEPGRRA